MSAAGTDIPLTPLLARLYIDRAIELMRAGRSMEELPTSIAEAHFEFIRLLLRKEPSLDQATALACIKTLGKVTLGERFIPSKLPLAVVLVELKSLVADRGMAVVKTLIAAGVLREEEMGLGKSISFTLDPVAEFCAAYAYAEDLGFDLLAWSRFRDKLFSGSSFPLGFRDALRAVVQSSARKGICTNEVVGWFMSE